MPDLKVLLEVSRFGSTDCQHKACIDQVSGMNK
jgi:hypothetical protein